MTLQTIYSVSNKYPNNNYNYLLNWKNIIICQIKRHILIFEKNILNSFVYLTIKNIVSYI